MNEVSPIALFKSVVDEERWVQGTWFQQRDGKDYLCLAAAWGKPGAINDPKDCPTNLFPQWLFELMPFLDDGVDEQDVPWLFKGFAELADGMAQLSPEAWERIRTGFMIRSMHIAVERAGSVQPDPKPAYWQPVVDAIRQVADALKAGLPEELKKARAAADAAAYAARAAADAAAYAARAAVVRELAQALFNIIEAEIAA